MLQGVCAASSFQKAAPLSGGLMSVGSMDRNRGKKEEVEKVEISSLMLAGHSVGGAVAAVARGHSTGSRALEVSKSKSARQKQVQQLRGIIPQPRKAGS